MLGVGLQIFALVTLALTILLAAYAIYVRIRSSTYTERKFSFVALWSCASVIAAAFLSVTDANLLSLAASSVGIRLEVTTLPEKALIVILAIAYCHIVRGWSLGWHGLLTEQGRRNRERGKVQGFVREGIEETARVLSRQPPLPPATVSPHEERKLVLGSPLDELPLHEQIRLLVEAKWSEYEIHDDDWVGEALCWQGIDRAFDQTILIACGATASQFPIDPLLKLANSKMVHRGLRILFVFRKCDIGIKPAFRALSGNCDIEVLSLDQLVEKIANFDEYRRSIEIEFKQKKLPDAAFAIADVLAPTRIYLGLTPRTSSTEEQDERQAETPPIDFENLVLEWLKDQSSAKQLALLGEYGQGKSTAVLALTYKLLCDENMRLNSSNRIPILIRLTGRSPSTARLAELLGAWGAQYNLSGQVLLALHRAGRLLLIFDAFDEMAHVMDRTARFEHFDALWEFASGGTKLLFTGRPNFFLDDEELKEVLGIAKGSATGPYCEALRVAPFEIEQIERAVNWLQPDKHDALVQAATKSSALREMCCRPSLLYLIAHLWDRGRLDLQSANVNSAGVVREFISYSLERQVQKQKDEASRRPERQFLSLTKSELDYFNSGIAVASLTEGRQNSIPKEVFESRIHELYERIPEASLKPGKDEVRSLAVPLKMRLSDLTNPVEACIQAVRTHGVIEHDVSRSRHYRFSHKSFCEVLAAEVLTNFILTDDDVSAAIERANSTSLVELVSQPQIIEFVADFLSADAANVKSLSYVDLYRKVFPSKFDQYLFVRARSIFSTAHIIVSHKPRFRLLMYLSFILLTALPFSVLSLFRHKAALQETYDPFDIAQTMFSDPAFWIAVFTILPMTYLMFRTPGLIIWSVPKFYLIQRLCTLFQKNGRQMYPTSMERRAYDIISEVFEPSIRRRRPRREIPVP
jgi:hypothetical protein